MSLPGQGSADADPLRSAELAHVQRRSLGTLASAQVLGAVGMSSGIAVAALLAAEVGGSASLSGLANTAQVLGTALLTAPVAALMARRGRRPGLLLGYGLAFIGAGLIVLAASLGQFPLLLLGALLLGAATTAGNQARYAATDLAPAARRQTHLSLVVWAATVGAVVGPNLVGPGARVAESLGLPPLAGPFLFAAAGFLLAGAAVWGLLRPDPLLTARSLEVAGSPRPTSLRRGWSVIAALPQARFGTLAITAGHMVMVAVMVMTPLHMRGSAHEGHGLDAVAGHAGHGADVEVIGFVISVHILGMYALSPLFGHLADRWGPRPVVGLGSVLLLAACALSGFSPQGWSWTLLVGLLLLGLGWSATLVAGSGTIAGALATHDKAAGQGAADITMGLGGAAAGALAGVIVGGLGYGWLCAVAAVVAALLGVASARRPGLVSLEQ